MRPNDQLFRLAGCLLFLAGATLPCGSVAAVEVDVPLTVVAITPGSSQLELTAMAGDFSDTDTSQLSGGIQSRLELSLVSGGPVATGIRFDGGSIAASVVDFDLTIATVTTTDLAGNVTTVGSGFNPVTDGQFSTAGNLFTIDQGTIVAGGIPTELSTNPLTYDTANETGSVVVQPFSIVDREAIFGVILTLPVSQTDTVTPGLTLNAQGDIVAVGQFSLTLPEAGDFNRDGVVDVADYTVWRDGFEAGELSIDDYAAWRDNFGATSSVSTSSISAVPEPANLVVWPLLVAVLAFFADRSTRRRAQAYAKVVR